MQQSEKWCDQIGFYRFWNNDNVTEETLIDCSVDHSVKYCEGIDHVLLLEDTTELNLEKHRHRITDTDGLGVVGNNKDLGFFCHPTLAVNAQDNSLIGVIDVHLWSRSEDKKDKHEREYKQQSLLEKESYRWPSRAIVASGRLKSVKRITVVQDREGDIFESYHLLKEAGLDFVIRCNHDRKLSEVEERLKEYLNNLSVAFECELEVKGDNKQRKKRKAQMEVRYDQVNLLRPSNIVGAQNYPPSLTVNVVHVREKQSSVPKGEKPIEWILYTTHEVTSEASAMQIVEYYRSRWIIEDLFRTVKTEGVNYEESELETGKRLRKLFVMALTAAIQILQLRQSREGKTTQKITLVFSQKQIACMKDLLKTIEGKTQKQKNLFSEDNLAWGTWIIGRLGGWKGYRSQRPPGVITLHEGWVRFQNIFQGWCMAKNCV